jgi:hypothetical protein
VKHAFTINAYNASQSYIKRPGQCLTCMEMSKVGHTRDREDGPYYRCNIFQLLEPFYSLSLTCNQCPAQIYFPNGCGCIFILFLRLILHRLQMCAPTLLLLKWTVMCLPQSNLHMTLIKGKWCSQGTHTSDLFPNTRTYWRFPEGLYPDIISCIIIPRLHQSTSCNNSN